MNPKKARVGYMPRLIILDGPGEYCVDAGGVYMDKEDCEEAARIESILKHGSDDEYWWYIRKVEVWEKIRGVKK